MPLLSLTRTTLAAFIGCLAATRFATIAIAQPQLQAPSSTELARIAEEIARRSHTRVLIEPGLTPNTALRLPSESLPVEKALSRLASQLRDGAWVRLALRVTPGERPPAAGRLARLMRNLAASRADRLIENVQRGKALLLQPSASGPPNRDQPALDRFYLLYRTRLPLGEGEETGLPDLQEEHLSLIEGLSPADTPNPMRAWVEALTGLGQDQMMRIVGPMAQAGDSLWKSTPPEQRADILGDSMKVAKTYGGGIEGLAPGGAPPAAHKEEKAAPRNYLAELRNILAELAYQHSIRVLVEPTLYIAQRPGPVDKSLGTAESLDAALASNRDIAWRRVVLPAGKAPPLPGELAAQVRLWESANVDQFILEAGSPRVSAGALTLTGEALKAAAACLGEGRETIYLIYGITDHRSKPASARLTDLLRSQMEQMVRMSPEEISSTMTDAIQEYHNAGPTRREKLMALPVMAGMMATWFPHAAKEGILKP